MQRRERHVLFERGHDRGIDADRLVVLEPAVNDSMADRSQTIFCEMLAQERKQVIERAVMAELRAVAPRLLGKLGAFRVLRDEARRCVEALDLATRRQRKLATDHLEQ